MRYGQDRYHAELQELYADAQEKCEEIPYPISRRFLKRFMVGVAYIWPYLSALTAIAFVWLFVSKSMRYTFSSPWKEQVSFWAVLVVVAGLIITIEVIKRTSNHVFWREKVNKRRVSAYLVLAFVCTSIVSTVVSSGGVYLTSLEATGHDLRLQQNSELAALDKSHQATMQGFAERRQAAESNAGVIQKQISDLRADKVQDHGQLVTKWGSSKKAAELAPTLAEATARIAGIADEKQAAQGSYEVNRQAIMDKYPSLKSDAGIFSSSQNGTTLALIFACIIAFVEILNVFANWYVWHYLKKTQLESQKVRVYVEESVSGTGSSGSSGYPTAAQRAESEAQQAEVAPQAKQKKGLLSGLTSWVERKAVELRERQTESPEPPPNVQRKGEENVQNAHPKNVQKAPGKMPQNPEQKDPQIVQEFQREITLNNSHLKFSKHVQPDKFRGIDEKKYKKFLPVARKVLSERGKYVRTDIARRVGIDRRTVGDYLKLAIEVRNDLES